MREDFFNCKNWCVCGSTPCKAKRYKECSVCHNVLASICSKAQCKSLNREMIKPACAISRPTSCRRNQHDTDSETTESSDDEMVFASTTDSEALSTDFYAGDPLRHSDIDISTDEDAFRRANMEEFGKNIG